MHQLRSGIDFDTSRFESVVVVVEHSERWQSALMVKYPALFSREFDGKQVLCESPSVGDGWRDLVETAIARIAKIVDGEPSASLTIEDVKSKYGTIRIYYNSTNLSEASITAVDEAINLAEARSACTCETCGEEGRLYENGHWFDTACNLHGRGTPAVVRPGWENLEVSRSTSGKVTCRRYDRVNDCFVDVDPATVDLSETD